jgi:hypothetical protein
MSLCLMFGFLVPGRARAHRGAFHGVQQPVASRPAPRAWSSLSERERRVVDLAQGVAEDLGVDEGVSADESPSATSAPATPSRERETPEKAPASDASMRALPAHGRVLVLADLTSGVDERVVRLLSARLCERSYRVVGDETDEGAAALAVELLAEARHALGLGHADEPATQAALQRFLDGSDDLAALILVSRATETEAATEHLYRVFVRHAPAESTGSAGD